MISHLPDVSNYPLKPFNLINDLMETNSHHNGSFSQAKRSNYKKYFMARISDE